MLHLGGRVKLLNHRLPQVSNSRHSTIAFGVTPNAALSRLGPEAPALEDKALKRFIYSRHERL